MFHNGLAPWYGFVIVCELWKKSQTDLEEQVSGIDESRASFQFSTRAFKLSSNVLYNCCSGMEDSESMEGQ
jgi:hypothetical protein